MWNGKKSRVSPKYKELLLNHRGSGTRCPLIPVFIQLSLHFQMEASRRRPVCCGGMPGLLSLVLCSPLFLIIVWNHGLLTALRQVWVFYFNISLIQARHEDSIFKFLPSLLTTSSAYGICVIACRFFTWEKKKKGSQAMWQNLSLT